MLCFIEGATVPLAIFYPMRLNIDFTLFRFLDRFVSVTNNMWRRRLVTGHHSRAIVVVADAGAATFESITANHDPEYRSQPPFV